MRILPPPAQSFPCFPPQNRENAAALLRTQRQEARMNKSNRFSLLLVDDEPWALSGMEEIIPWEEYGFEIVGKCSTASEALRLLGEKKPQAVFTDIPQAFHLAF